MTEVATVIAKRALRTVVLGALVLLCAAPGAGAAGLALGSLTPLPCVEGASSTSTACPTKVVALDNPSQTAVSPDGLSVYAVSPSDNAVVAFDRSPDGTLTPAGCFVDVSVTTAPCGAGHGTAGLLSPQSVTVSPDGRSVYVGSVSQSGALVRFDRAPDGRLTPAGCFSGFSLLTACAPAPLLFSARDLAVSPDGRSVYATAGGALVRLDRAEDGSLTPAGCIESASGTSCAQQLAGFSDVEGVAVSPDSASVYVATGAFNRIFRFQRAADGALTPAGCFEDTGSLPGGSICGTGHATPALNDPTALTVSPDGRSVYVTTRLSRSVVAFDRAADGSLTAAGCFEDTSESACGPGRTTAGMTRPMRVVATRDGHSVYVAGLGALVRFDRAADGSLTPAGCVEDLTGTLCSQRTAGLSAVFDVAASADGASLYVVGFTDRTIVPLARRSAPVCSAPAAPVAVTAGGSVTIPLPCVDPDGDALTRQIVSAPVHGTLGAIDAQTGSVTYKAAAGYGGLDAFSFTAADGNGDTATPVTVALTVTAGGGGQNGGGSGGGGGPGGSPPPGVVRLSALRLVPASFVAFAGRGASTALRLSSRRGARVTYRLTRAARVVFQVLQHRAGRLAGRRCVAPTRANRRGGRCTRTVTLRGSFAQAGRAGANTLVFTGRLNRRALAPGAYLLAATPAGGRAVRATFTVKRRR